MSEANSDVASEAVAERSQNSLKARNDRKMTKEVAVSLLHKYGRDAYRYRTNGYVLCAKRNVDYLVSVYGRFLVDYLIQEIKKSTDDPISTVQSVYSYLDWVLGDSDDDHFETHQFASRMEYETGNILRYLMDVEKEK